MKSGHYGNNCPSMPETKIDDLTTDNDSVPEPVPEPPTADQPFYPTTVHETLASDQPYYTDPGQIALENYERFLEDIKPSRSYVRLCQKINEREQWKSLLSHGKYKAQKYDAYANYHRYAIPSLEQIQDWMENPVDLLP